MKMAGPIGLLLLPGLVAAVNCKKVYAEGGVANKEQPADEFTTRVESPEY